MKYTVPLVLVLLIGIAAGLRRGDGPAAETPRPEPRIQEAVSVPAEVPVLQESSAPTVAARSPQAPPLQASQAVQPAPVTWRKLYGTLDRKLGLTTTQKAAVQEVLETREKEIKTWHEAIRKAGLLDIRQYDWEAALMKESWYLRLDGLFDVAQHELFGSLVAGGLLNDGLAFTVEPGMTVLD